MTDSVPSNSQLASMIERAREVAQQAYVPASNFRVGASLLASDGRVFTGCNVENASYGLTVCAERNAVFHAVAEGAREFTAVVIYTELEEPASPCGACRQVLAEFGRDMKVVLVGDGDAVVHTDMLALLPNPFVFSSEDKDL